MTILLSDLSPVLELGGADKHMLNLDMSQYSTETHYMYSMSFFTHANSKQRKQRSGVADCITQLPSSWDGT